MSTQQAQLSYNGTVIEALVRRGRKHSRVRLVGSTEPVLVPTSEIDGLAPKSSKPKKAKAKADA